jgi:predicted 3-demethylubiquinone-9 3-methyltransferase (glyoxalase superfamily)
VSMFPPLADEWWKQVQDQMPWKSFKQEDFLRLKDKYGVSWVVVQPPAGEGFECPYQNAAVRVCRLR